MRMKTLLIGAGLLALAAAVIVVRASGVGTTAWRHAVNPGSLSQPHAFLETRCDACHTPAKGVEASNCIVCHANNEALLQRQPTAFHGNIGSCKECHAEHGGRIQHPIVMDHAALSRIGLQKAANESLLNCAACHAKEDPHSAQFGLSCIACHDTERWSITEFRHPSPRSQDCAQCHQAPPCHQTTHYREVCAQVAGKPNAEVRECYSCHQSTLWNDIKGVGWYKSH